MPLSQPSTPCRCHPAAPPITGTDAYITAALAVAAYEEADARHRCQNCPESRYHAVTLVVGFTPAGDECRCCPEHVAVELARRGVLVARPAVARAVSAYTERVVTAVSRSWA